MSEEEPKDWLTAEADRLGMVDERGALLPAHQSPTDRELLDEAMSLLVATTLSLQYAHNPFPTTPKEVKRYLKRLSNLGQRVYPDEENTDASE